MTAPAIAVLDNDLSFLSSMHDLLTGEGYRALLWHTQAERDLHTLLRRAQPALVILDLWIEKRDDGWEFLKGVWGDVETTHIPAVIVSGKQALPPVRVDVLRAMHCPVVRTPFDLPDVLVAIAQVLGPSPVRWDRGMRTCASASADGCTMHPHGIAR